jgi:hypothetical protein
MTPSVVNGFDDRKGITADTSVDFLGVISVKLANYREVFADCRGVEDEVWRNILIGWFTERKSMYVVQKPHGLVDIRYRIAMYGVILGAIKNAVKKGVDANIAWKGRDKSSKLRGRWFQWFRCILHSAIFEDRAFPAEGEHRICIVLRQMPRRVTFAPRGKHGGNGETEGYCSSVCEARKEFREMFGKGERIACLLPSFGRGEATPPG